MNLGLLELNAYTANSDHHLVRRPVDIVNVKVNVKLFLCLTKHHAMKTYWGVEM